MIGRCRVVHRRDFYAYTNLYARASHEGAGTKSGSRAWQVHVGKSQVHLGGPLLYHNCLGIIILAVIRLVEKHRTLVEYPLKPCTNAFSRTMGLLCAHKIEECKAVGGLQPQDFHRHWFWNRYPSPLRPPILEPLQVIRTGAVRKGLKGSTKRLPLGFEATEKHERRCGLCRNPGHNRNSYLCPKRL